MAKILGKLRGIIASAREESRNGRKYTERFWDDIFNSDLFLEGIENKMYFGNMWHPEGDDYGQVHPGDDAAVILEKVEKKGLDYYGTFIIPPTRTGETLKNLIDIGCVFGISSRGYSDVDVNVFDDASIYDLITFDVVAFPGIKSARLHPISAVAESINFNKKQSKKKIMENLNRLANEDDKIKDYISDVLKKKEDFDTKLQIEDVDDYFSDIEDKGLLDFLNVIRIDDKGIPMYDDGIHGEHYVYTFSLKDEFKDAKPDDRFFVDELHYNDKHKGYLAIGDWIKLS